MKFTSKYWRQMAAVLPTGGTGFRYIHPLHTVYVRKEAQETAATLSRILYMKKNIRIIFIKKSRDRYV